MSSVPTNAAPMYPPPEPNSAALHAAVEGLFRAGDAAAVMETCAAMIHALGVRGSLVWRQLEEAAVAVPF